jgi:hypothetical protein
MTFSLKHNKIIKMTLVSKLERSQLMARIALEKSKA